MGNNKLWCIGGSEEYVLHSPTIIEVLTVARAQHAQVYVTRLNHPSYKRKVRKDLWTGYIHDTSLCALAIVIKYSRVDNNCWYWSVSAAEGVKINPQASVCHLVACFSLYPFSFHNDLKFAFRCKTCIQKTKIICYSMFTTTVNMTTLWKGKWIEI